MILTKDLILKADDRPTERVTVEEWGGDVIVKTMSGAERDEFEEALFTGKGTNQKQNFKHLRARLVALVTVDEQGKRIFGNDDVPALSQKSARALDKIFSVAQRLNGIGQKEVDELVKN